MLASGTLHTALRRLARSVPVINNGSSFRIEDAANQAIFALATDGSAYPSPLAQEDSLWSWTGGFSRITAGSHLDPAEVCRLYSEAPCIGDSFGCVCCPVRFRPLRAVSV